MKQILINILLVMITLFIIYIFIKYKSAEHFQEKEELEYTDFISIESNDIRVNDVDSRDVTLKINNINLVDDINNTKDKVTLDINDLEFLQEIPYLRDDSNNFQFDNDFCKQSNNSTESHKLCIGNLYNNTNSPSQEICFDRDDFFALNNYFMPGTVVMYNNPINTIPKGWLLCDGTNGTPDLRDRFIIGGTIDTLNKSGGSKREIITENTFPNHSHLFPIFQQQKSSDAEQRNRGSGGSWLTKNIEEKEKEGRDTLGSDVPDDIWPQNGYVTHIEKKCDNHECWFGKGSFCKQDEGERTWAVWSQGFVVSHSGSNGFEYDMDPDAWDHSKKHTYSKNGVESHENMPQYYALYYIMREFPESKPENFKVHKPQTTELKKNLVDPCSKFNTCYTCLKDNLNEVRPKPPDYCVWENNKCVKKNIDTDNTCNIKTVINENKQTEIQYDNNCNIPNNTRSTQKKLMGNDIHKKYNDRLDSIISGGDKSFNKFRTKLTAKEICDLK